MSLVPRPFFIATRGSALALAQANMILTQCRSIFPQFTFELNIIRTTGDELQAASMAKENKDLPKGLFTKELELALLQEKADLAVHSLKDLPTELPAGLVLGAVAERADVRDVLIYRSQGHGNRGFQPHLAIKDLPEGSVIATSSTRRKAQLLALNPGLKVPEIRGNVGTRLQKVAQKTDLDGTILALAGLTRLHYRVTPPGHLEGEGIAEGLLATILDLDVMLPCVGQGAIGIEIRDRDERLQSICEWLNHFNTLACVTAERAFLAEMGGGCQSPVAAYAQVAGDQIQMKALSFANGPLRRGESAGPLTEPIELGRRLAGLLRG